MRMIQDLGTSSFGVVEAAIVEDETAYTLVPVDLVQEVERHVFVGFVVAYR